MHTKRVIIFALFTIFILTASLAGFVYADSLEEIERDKEVVKMFIEALNNSENKKAMGFLAENISYIEKYADGSEYKLTGKEELSKEIDSLIESNSRIIIHDIMTGSDGTIRITGRASDFVTEVLGFDGLTMFSQWKVKNNKITSVFMERDKGEEIKLEQQTGGSIGVWLDIEGPLSVIKCAEDSPADKAGLKSGDIIEAVDGLKIENMKYGNREALYRIRGPVGEKVRLTINRDGEILEIELERK